MALHWVKPVEVFIVFPCNLPLSFFFFCLETFQRRNYFSLGWKWSWWSGALWSFICHTTLHSFYCTSSHIEQVENKAVFFHWKCHKVSLKKDLIKMAVTYPNTRVSCGKCIEFWWLETVKIIIIFICAILTEVFCYQWVVGMEGVKDNWVNPVLSRLTTSLAWESMSYNSLLPLQTWFLFYFCRTKFRATSDRTNRVIWVDESLSLLWHLGQ